MRQRSFRLFPCDCRSVCTAFHQQVKSSERQETATNQKTIVNSTQVAEQGAACLSDSTMLLPIQDMKT